MCPGCLSRMYHRRTTRTQTPLLLRRRRGACPCRLSNTTPGVYAGRHPVALRLDDVLPARPAFVFPLSIARQVTRLARRIAPVRLEQDVSSQDDLRALDQRDAALATPIGATEHDPVEQAVQTTAILRQVEGWLSLEQ